MSFRYSDHHIGHLPGTWQTCADVLGKPWKCTSRTQPDDGGTSGLIAPTARVSEPQEKETGAKHGVCILLGLAITRDTVCR